MQPAVQTSESTALYRIHPCPATLIERLSPTSRRNRFLSAVKPLAVRLMPLARVDCARQIAPALISDHGADELVVAQARFGVDGTGSAAEFAVMVDDPWASRGIGTWLVQALRRASAQRAMNTANERGCTP